MLYLAEVKNQNRGFVGGYKTELQLLASQEADQTWNNVSSKDIINVENINEAATKGTLYIVNLNSNQQPQAVPELAGNRIVNYLRYLSRALEKSKTLESDIENWKDSLRLQGEQIELRQNELDTQQQIISQQQQELAQLEEEKEKLNGAWEQLRVEQSRSNQAKNKLSELLEELNNNTFSQPENIPDLFSVIDRQQQLLDTYWQQLESEKNTLPSGQNDLKTKQIQLNESRQDLNNLQKQLQSASIRRTSNQNLVSEKEEALRQCDAQLIIIDRLEQEVMMIADDGDDNNIDTNALENMPLGDLENTVDKLQQETSKLVNFVNLQEEELSLQSDEVKSIEEQINKSTAVEKFSLENELADAQEAMKLLNETLVGQRKTLKNQQKTLNEHLKILTRRKGVGEIDFTQTINVKPLLAEITHQRQQMTEKKANLTSEIEQLNLLVNQLDEQLPTLEQEYEEQKQLAQAREQQLLQIYQQVTETECNVSLLEQLLEPIQEQLTIMTENISNLQPSANNGNINHLLDQLRSIL